MQAPLKFSIADPGGKVMLAGDGSGTIGAEALTIHSYCKSAFQNEDLEGNSVIVTKHHIWREIQLFR